MRTYLFYIAPCKESNIQRPAHQLRQFEKISLAPGESKDVVFTLSSIDFSVYDVDAGTFVTVPGEYEIQAAASSRDIRLSARINV